VYLNSGHLIRGVFSKHIIFCAMFQFYSTRSVVAINSISTHASSFKAFFPFSIYLMINYFLSYSFQNKPFVFHHSL
jgi:hypothetical protein